MSKKFKCFSCADLKQTVENNKDRIRALEGLVICLAMRFNFQPMETAPKNEEITMITADDVVVDGYWCEKTEDRYKSDPFFQAVYDPENSKGTWMMTPGEGDRRMYCGMTPQGWMPKLNKTYFKPDGYDEFFDPSKAYDVDLSKIKFMEIESIIAEIDKLTEQLS